MPILLFRSAACVLLGSKMDSTCCIIPTTKCCWLSPRTPAKHMASNAYVLVNAALMVFFEQAQSPSVAAVAMDCLKHILGSMSTGEPGCLIACNALIAFL